MEKINFRKAVDSDYSHILQLKRQVHEFHHAQRPDFYRTTKFPFEKTEFDNLINNKNSDIFIVEKDGIICGYAITKIIEFKDNPLVNNHKRLFIDDICIDNSFRKKGIGQFLMEKLELICKSDEFEYLDLNVWDFNTDAIDFYKKTGMKEIMIRMEKKIIK